MPEGNEGKMPAGRVTPLLKANQKHLGQSFNKLSDDGENL
jgi:hypothetical protein